MKVMNVVVLQDLRARTRGLEDAIETFEADGGVARSPALYDALSLDHNRY